MIIVPYSYIPAPCVKQVCDLLLLVAAKPFTISSSLSKPAAVTCTPSLLTVRSTISFAIHACKIIELWICCDAITVNNVSAHLQNCLEWNKYCMDHQGSAVHPDCQAQRSKSSAPLKGTNRCAYNFNWTVVMMNSMGESVGCHTQCHAWYSIINPFNLNAPQR